MKVDVLLILDKSLLLKVKAQNKKEAVNLAYESFGHGELKKNFVAQDLEKEHFKANGFDRKVVMLS